ncbi:MAG TPA: PKD domain-containing protein [Thermoplasmata archaeon]|nr:PKD domain-containing protein [Thermoplasmata archaeon]
MVALLAVSGLALILIASTVIPLSTLTDTPTGHRSTFAGPAVNCTGRTGPPAIQISASPPNGTAPLTVQFSSNVTGGCAPYNVSWRLGEETYRTGPNISYTFQTAGVYDVVANATDSAGNWSTARTTVTVRANCTGHYGLPSISIRGSPNTGTAPLTVQFSANVTGGCPPYRVHWEFGDESEQSGFNTSYTYLSAGTFNVLATVRDAAGNTSQAQMTIVVTGGAGPLTVAVAAVPTTGSTPLAVTAWANVTGGNATSVSIRWAFGDGGTGTGSPVSHIYETVGTFTATATAQGTTTAIGTVKVTVLPASGPPASANLSLIPDPAYVNAPAQVAISVYSNGVSSPYRLSVCFGDGSPCVDGAPSWTGAQPLVFDHLFSTPGNDSVVGTLSNSSGDVLAGATVVVWVFAGPLLTVVATDSRSSGTAPFSSSFEANVSGGTPPYSIAWTFGDGSVGSSVSGEPVAHTYLTSGTFLPSVQVRDSGGHAVNRTVEAVSVSPSSALLPKTYHGVPTSDLLVGSAVGVLGGAIALLVWSRRRRRANRVRTEGERLVRKLEGTE